MIDTLNHFQSNRIDISDAMPEEFTRLITYSVIVVSKYSFETGNSFNSNKMYKNHLNNNIKFVDEKKTWAAADNRRYIT